MLDRLVFAFRPFGVALAVYVLLNVALAVQNPAVATTSIWLPLPLREPELSLLAGLLGAALLLPHATASGGTLRWALEGVFLGFAILSLVGVGAYYHGLSSGQFATDFPLPLGAFVAALLVVEAARVHWWKPRASRSPLPALVFFRGLAVVGAFLGWTFLHVVTYGHIDHTRKADAAVVLGAKVFPDGRLSGALQDRVETGVLLYEKGWVPLLIFSGAVDPNGQSEPVAMRRYALARNVPADRIILDEGGVNTRASAINVKRLAGELGLRSVLAVSQDFHCARVEMVFEREGLRTGTVPTCALSRLAPTTAVTLQRQGYFLFREVVAFPFYLLYHR